MKHPFSVGLLAGGIVLFALNIWMGLPRTKTVCIHDTIREPGGTVYLVPDKHHPQRPDWIIKKRYGKRTAYFIPYEGAKSGCAPGENRGWKVAPLEQDALKKDTAKTTLKESK